MTIPVSTVPLAVAQLLADVQAQVDANEPIPAAIKVCLGQPGKDQPNDIIAVGLPQIPRQVDPLAFVGDMGQGSLDEVYEIQVTVSSWIGAGEDPTSDAALLARAAQLVAYVETAVRSDPSLNGLVLQVRPAGTTFTGLDNTGDPTGRVADALVRLRVEATS